MVTPDLIQQQADYNFGHDPTATLITVMLLYPHAPRPLFHYCGNLMKLSTCSKDISDPMSSYEFYLSLPLQSNMAIVSFCFGFLDQSEGAPLEIIIGR